MIEKVCYKAIRLVVWYQKRISPHLPCCCRYRPSCSQYFLDALVRYGFLRGVIKGVWRILRCNPFSRGGWDPV